MSLPSDLTLITITGTYLDSQGNPATGTVNFSSSQSLRNSTDTSVVVIGSQTVELDATGSFSIALPATNDPDWQPQGWTYTATERVSNRSAANIFSFALPYNTAGGTITIGALTPIPPVTAPNIYVLLSQVGIANGVASLDGTANVPLSQLGNAPSGGGGTPSGTVTSSAVTDAGTAGVATAYSRGDHNHPREGFGAPTALVAYGVGSAAGTALTVPHSDHVHGSPALPTNAQIGSQPSNASLTALGALASTGLVAQTGANTFADRTLTAGSTSVSVTNGAGTAGNPTVDVVPANFTGIPESAVTGLVTALAGLQPSSANLTNLAALAGTGFLAQTAANTFAERTLTGSTEIGITNTAGVAGNPVVSTNSVAPTASAVTDTSTSGTIATHRHAREGFAAPVALSAYGVASATGTAPTVPRSDHVHGSPALPTSAQVGAVPTWVVTATKTSAYTANPGEFVLADVSAGTFAVTLPAASTAGQRVAAKIIALNASASIALSITAAGTDHIEGSTLTTVTVTGLYQVIELVSTGAGVWWVDNGQLTTFSAAPSIAAYKQQWFNYLPATTTPDMEEVYAGSGRQKTAWRNEVGMFRGQPADYFKTDAILRGYQNPNSPTLTAGNWIEMKDSAGTNTWWGIRWDGAPVAGDGTTAPQVMSHTLHIVGAGAVPAGTPANTVIIRT